MPVSTKSTSIIPTTVNKDLVKERRGASFDVEEFAKWWHESEEKLKEKREIEQYIFNGLEDDYGLKHEYMSHEDVYTDSLRQIVLAHKKMKELQAKKNPGGPDPWPKLLYGPHSHGLFPGNNPLTTHITMFVNVIMTQGTPEQIEKFGRPAEKCSIIGCYAQTELAHGTYLRGIQTRADYDSKTDEFVLNTPSLEAYKWWPGGMGHTANYGMVVAQLYINNEHKGIQMFIVQLRDLETHMPLPGIDIGEVGKKVGMHAVNQGFLGLKNVRIPRENMLMKNAKVLPGGSFVESPVSRLSYMTMVFTRCLIASAMPNFHLEAATIATRYAAVRRQSPINPNEPEPQIIDHVTQRLKLFPEIATGIAYRLAATGMWDLYDLTLKEIEMGKYERMPGLHALSCILKVLSTTDTCAGIERLRLACGGHGYLAAANFGNIYGNAVAACTYEGENTILLLQVGRYLVKRWIRLTEGKRLMPIVSYFNLVNGQCIWNDSWYGIVEALQFTAAHKTRLAFEAISKHIADGHTKPEAANYAGIELTQAAELHGRQYVAAQFVIQITGSKKAQRSPALQNVLENLLELYLVHSVLQNMGNVLRFVKLTDADITSLQRRLEVALEKLRPNAVAVCDGFDFHDRVLNSDLGCYDGNVYERLFDSAKKSPMNQKPVPDGFEKYLKPFMKSNL